MLGFYSKIDIKWFKQSRTVQAVSLRARPLAQKLRELRHPFVHALIPNSYNQRRTLD